ncbi:MAG: hypothetical protein IPL65_10770 [Lewinellaceae bacterium]|nr:hypothetical protein [Lewinellaceae bacterium]
MKNYLGQSFALSALVAAMLTALSFLPENGLLHRLDLRRMDIYADVRSSDSTLLAALPLDSIPAAIADTLVLVLPDSIQEPAGPLPEVDPTLFGKIFEDYSPQQQGLDAFFEAIDNIKKGHSARVAFFGDSFVEGDILLGDLRDTLQTLWGGEGVGFVPITSEVARFKRTLVHDYKGWNIYSIVKKTDTHPPYGINGFVYVPFEGAKVKYQGADWFKHTRHWTQTRLFYTSDSLSSAVLSVNGGPEEIRSLPIQSKDVGAIEIRAGNIRSIQMNFPQTKGLKLYGASLESGQGIYIDNFSVRGNSGGRLREIACPMMKAFDHFQDYDLIVIQLGLNAATNSLNNINWYRYELERTFTHMKACFPDKPILIISVPDRSSKIAGELTTMPSIPVIVSMQRDLARQFGFLFFDLYHGMGGPGTMIDYANQRPALANRDYTHLTHEGGRVVSYLFLQRFMAAQEAFQQAHAPAQ